MSGQVEINPQKLLDKLAAPRIRVFRSTTLEINGDYEKAEYQVEVPLPGYMGPGDIRDALKQAEELLEERIRNFTSTHAPKKSQPSTPLKPGGTAETGPEWKPWTKGSGESFPADKSVKPHFPPLPLPPRKLDEKWSVARRLPFLR